MRNGTVSERDLVTFRRAYNLLCNWLDAHCPDDEEYDAFYDAAEALRTVLLYVDV